MKRHFLLAGAALAFGIISCTNAPESDEAVTSDARSADSARGNAWQVNTDESSIEWIGTKVSGYHTGEVPVKTGTLFVENGNVTGGNFIMDLANMTVSGPKGSDTAQNRKLLGHLQSGDFFDVSKYPEAKFELTSLEPFSGAVRDTTDPRQEEISEYKVADPTHTVSGNLTIKDVTKNISFPAKITVSGNSAEAVAKFNINRQEWNITYPGQPDDLIRDAIHLGIRIRANEIDNR